MHILLIYSIFANRDPRVKVRAIKMKLKSAQTLVFPIETRWTYEIHRSVRRFLINLREKCCTRAALVYRSLRIVRLRLQFARAFWSYIFRINIVLFRLMELHVYTLQSETNDRSDDHFRRSIADVYD